MINLFLTSFQVITLIQILLLPKLLSALQCPKTIGRVVTSLSVSERIDTERIENKQRLLTFLEEVPTNAPTSKNLTDKILSCVRKLENCCPTENVDVLTELGGSWDLLWTAQDRSSPEGMQSALTNWIK